MDFLPELVKEVVAGLGTAAAVNVAGYFLGLFKVRANELNGSEIRKLLEQLGETSADSIRDLVWRTLSTDDRISDKQREDLAAVLTALARGANQLNSQGSPLSVFVRSQELIEQLLKTIQPRRKAGEKVCPNHCWVLQRFLGMGSFGEVWLATNVIAPRLGPRAFKIFTQERAAGWLNREKESLLEVRDRLNDHPQIVRLIDVGVPQEGHPFLELEFVAGGSLEDWITDARRADRPLSKAVLMRGIVRAVASAHRRGVYHCDLKPANILLTGPPDVQAKIADFGLANTANVRPERPEDAAETILAGTPMYWPPEAYRPFGNHSEVLFDVFALGVIWYQLLVERLDRPPYDFAAELRDSGVDSSTIGLISRCLAHPDRRFRDAAELEEHMDSADLPTWDTVPSGLFDVQHLVREFVGLAAK